MTTDHTPAEAVDDDSRPLAEPPPVDQVDDPDALPVFDPLAVLTLAELDSGSRLLKASLVHAVSARTQDYERALAVTGYLYERRTVRKADLNRWLGMTWAELHEAIEAMRPDPEQEAGPTGPGPA